MFAPNEIVAICGPVNTGLLVVSTFKTPAHYYIVKELNTTSNDMPRYRQVSECSLRKLTDEEKCMVVLSGTGKPKVGDSNTYFVDYKASRL